MSPANIEPAYLRCSACGYDLRGIDATMNCPECGKPVAHTLAGDPLSLSDPAWRRALVEGAIVLLPVVALRALLLSLWTYQSARFGNTIVWPPALSPQGQEIIEIVADVLGAIAIWLLTKPDLSFAPRAAGMPLTSAIRFLLGVRLISTILFHIGGDVIARRYQVGWALADRALGTVEFFLLFMLLEQSSARLPDRALANRFVWIRWCMLAAQVASVALETLPSGLGPSSPMRAYLTIPGYLLQITVDLWLILLLGRFARRVARVGEVTPAVHVA
jgi:hypothetical protein